MCKKTIHSEHSEKGVFFEYLEFINIARTRIHAYKEKFQKYVEACNIPKRDLYDTFVNENQLIVEKLFNDQKAKIDEQFFYLMKLIEELKSIEMNFLIKYRDFFNGLYGNVSDNYHNLIKEIQLGK
jgi:hypothetical protein